jgi:phenylalanyl-tRNA synthetase beta chain
MAEVGGGTLIGGWIDAYPNPIPKREITVSLLRVNRLLGTRFTRDAFKRRLESIEFRVVPLDENRLRVHVPSFRVDVKRPEDLMEEAARLAGYQHIPVTFPALPASKRRRSLSFQMKDTLRRWLAGFGFLEAITYSFIDRRFDDRLGLPENDFRRKTVEILNPLSDEQRRMRTTLIPGLLGALQRNLAQQIRSLRLFETGKVYLPQEAEVLPRETEMLALLWTGFRFEPGWYGKETPCDFFDMKGIVEGLLKALGVRLADAVPMQAAFCGYLKPGASAIMRIAGRDVGWVGEMRPSVLDTFDIHQAVFIAELNLDALMPFIPRVKKAVPISRFPRVTRDFTLIVDKTVPAGDILRCVTSSGEKWVKDVRLFDVFENTPIPPGKKSVSFRITYQSNTRTLEEKEVSRVHQKISDLLLKTFDAMLPE